MAEWNRIKVQELGRIVTGKTPKTSDRENYGGDIPFLTPSDDMSVKYVHNTGKTLTEKGKLSVKGAIIPKDSVCVSCIGSDLGKVVITSHETVTNQQINSIVVDKEKFDKDFIYYAMLILGKELNFYSKTSTAVPIVNKTSFSNYEIKCPDIKMQRRISSILSSLDEKIEENKTINENLADQAQLVLYHFMAQYQHHLHPLSDIADVIDCLHSKKPSAIEDSPYQLIQLDNISDDGFLDMSACKYMISQTDYENWTRKCEIIEGDCVITNVGRIGAVSQAPYGTKAAMGRNMTCIRLKSGLKLQAYFITVLLSNHMRRQIRHNTDEGTIMGALNVKNIPKLLFPVFDAPIMSVLESILYPLRKQIEYNNLQNQNLVQLRDVLLPRLMSGELDVSGLDF